MTSDNGRHAERGDVQQAPSEGCQSGPKASPEHRSGPSIDEELIERLREGREPLDELCDAAADRLESLLSDRAKLEERVRELEMQRLSTLAGMYHLFPNAVAKMCDETLDRSGALLGEVRKLVALNRSTDR